MIADKHIAVSLTNVAAWALWLLTVVFVGVSAGVHMATDDDDAFLIAALGLVCSTGAATLHIRSALSTFALNLKAAFEMGREVEREQQQAVRSIR